MIDFCDKHGDYHGYRCPFCARRAASRVWIVEEWCFPEWGPIHMSRTRAAARRVRKNLIKNARPGVWNGGTLRVVPYDRTAEKNS